MNSFAERCASGWDKAEGCKWQNATAVFCIWEKPNTALSTAPTAASWASELKNHHSRNSRAPGSIKQAASAAALLSLRLSLNSTLCTHTRRQSQARSLSKWKHLAGRLSQCKEKGCLISFPLPTKPPRHPPPLSTLLPPPKYTRGRWQDWKNEPAERSRLCYHSLAARFFKEIEHSSFGPEVALPRSAPARLKDRDVTFVNSQFLSPLERMTDWTSELSPPPPRMECPFISVFDFILKCLHRLFPYYH